MSKEENLKYIKDFSKISVSQVCRDLKVDRVNLMTGRASEENTEKVKNEIKKRIAALNE